MPSPASSPSRNQQRSQSHSQTITRRSTASGAYQNRSVTADAKSLGSQGSVATDGGKSALTGGANVAQASGAVQADNLSKRISVASVGTMVNPQATAAELLASKAPVIDKSPGHAYSRTVGGGFSGGADGVRASDNSTTLPTSPPQGPGALSVGPPSATLPQHSDQHPPGSLGGSISRPIGSSDQQSQAAYAQLGAAPTGESLRPALSAVGHGIIDVNTKTAAKLELIFSLIATGTFISLWIFMTASANCFYDHGYGLLIKISAAMGVLASLLIAFHSCFERRVAIGRGIFGCMVFFFMAIVTFVNLLMGFMSLNCICKCSPGQNAFSVNSMEDQVIFYLSLIGAFNLILVLIVSSVTHN